MKPNRQRIETSLAVRHVRSIRLAIKDMFSVQQILDAWFALHDPIDNRDENNPNKITPAQARDWAKIQVQVQNVQRLNNALARLYADGWALGTQLSTYDIARKVLPKAAPSKKQLLNGLNTNWSKWKPGNRAAAILVAPPNGLKRLLEQRNVKIQGMTNTTLDRIGTALADGLIAGSTRREIALDLFDIVDDASRALTIAGTEMRSAVVNASMDLYQDSGVEKVQWLVAEPCDLCMENFNQSPIGIDEEWINGEPPVHPNCMCDIAPYVVDTGLFANSESE
jgi:hypothetical protein